MGNQICEIISPVMLLLDRIERKLDRLSAASVWWLVFSESYAKLLQCVRLFVTLCTVALQAPLSMGFSGQECWSGLPCPPPGDLPDPGIEPVSPAFQADSFTAEPLRKPFRVIMVRFNSEGLLSSSLCCLPCVYASTSRSVFLIKIFLLLTISLLFLCLALPSLLFSFLPIFWNQTV